MQEICNSNPRVVTEIRDLNKFRTRHHLNFKLSSKLKHLKILIHYFVILLIVIWKKTNKTQHIIDLLSCIPNILWVIDLSLILFNTSWGTYSISKGSKYTALFLSINNETECLPLLFLSLRFLTYALSFFLVNCFLRKRH